jgi:hypothetical protein
VDPGQTTQLLLAEGLDTETHPIDPGGLEGGEPRLGDSLGIGFEGDFAIGALTANDASHAATIRATSSGSRSDGCRHRKNRVSIPTGPPPHLPGGFLNKR